MGLFGYYSQKQFENLKQNKERMFPYIYYKNKYNEVVQITEVNSDPHYQSSFEDIVLLGELQGFHCVSGVPLNFQNENSGQP